MMQTIKFRLSNSPLTPITSSDTAIAQLKTVQLSLTEQISLLTSRCQSLTQKAQEATSKHNRILTLSALKSRKLSETALQKRSDALLKIEEVLNGVEQAASDKEILKTLEGGVGALEKLNKDIGGIEKVERIMERVREGVEESEDVGRVIAEMGSNGRVDENEVMEEFEDMLKVEEDRTREIRDLEKKIRKREIEEEIRRQKMEEKAKEEELKKQNGLVEDLKSVSLDEDKETRIVEDPIPS